MSASDYLGSGLRLDQDFDLEVNSSGDLAADFGARNLRKDLALAVAEYLTVGHGERLPDVYEDNVTVPSSLDEGAVGQFITDGLLRDIAILTSSVISLDPRVEDVTSIDARRSDDHIDEIVVEARVLIVSQDEADFEFVIQVN